ncbi:hypothetical protein L596_001601 [Steinernema carpocapsae]|uniref:Uncharacterized protein n=1 Tax=Steinernema carpocapsae TaxID=34508 RepID=A0A4U8ULP2_STECR|nr:hypothetical protein L596_001601 [Steinernema carpocapsae]
MDDEEYDDVYDLPSVTADILQDAKNLAAKYPDHADLQGFFQFFTARYALHKKAPCADNNFLAKRRARSLCALPADIVHDFVNQDKRIKKSKKILQLRGIFGSVASKGNYVLTYLPKDIIKDISNQQGINCTNLVDVKGLYGKFAKQKSDVVVTLDGVFPSYNLAKKPVSHFTNLKQLNNVYINSVKIEEWNHPKKEKIKPKFVQTIQFALQGFVQDLYITCPGIPKHVLKVIFAEPLEVCQPKRVHLNVKRGHSISEMGPEFLDFLQNMFAQDRKERLIFNCRGPFDKASQKILLPAFHQERFQNFVCESHLGAYQLQCVLDIPDFVRQHDCSIFECQTSVKHLELKKMGAERIAQTTTEQVYKINKTHCRLRIVKNEKKLTVEIFKKQPAKQNRSTAKRSHGGNNDCAPKAKRTRT